MLKLSEKETFILTLCEQQAPLMERAISYKRQLNGAEDRQLWCLGGTTSEE